MPAQVRTFDVKRNKVLFGGIELTGFAADVQVEVTRDEDAFTKKVGVDGEVSRSRNNNKTGSVKISLMQTSPSNAVLSAAMLADEANLAAGVLPLLILDISGGALPSTSFAANAWVKKAPDQKFGKEVEVREWTLDCGDMDVFIGGN